MKVILEVNILNSCTKIELYLRHGSILAAGQIINALCNIARDKKQTIKDYLGILLN